MRKKKISIDGIPAIVWGKSSKKVYVHVHGKMSRKEYAEQFAKEAESKGYQTLSFDLPEHGERTDKSYRCDVWNGVRDLNVIADYAFAEWESVSLFAGSIGAYFSLNAYADRVFEKCLFQSPILDLKWLVEHMMIWSDVSVEQLETEGEIPTEIDTLRWDYYQYILSHPIEHWPFSTSILYGAKDNLQPIEVVRNFAAQFDANLTISGISEHAFITKQDFEIIGQWLEENV